ncbi:hypothetical protein P153DRAFT_366241 [Dothidotthia symphoricarpi CBS 119687]|uniref:Uncharacterized protein n=1 Tax=Dothidotthia symphoricarpi CBS 119687 TaxID=1392245 RepID=A0A6A6AD42_9PLEO|nr:uncharacterized protein P153DRAFT_366241 [Dothidotthia symphoricarpi CBS 119687]KAF2129739.1 hypothetical protein P153DRAFT_366241 [Dothidotthia symphoricarpi CBS 119687]
MLTDRDPNGGASGRTSRASNLSAMSRSTHKHSGGAGKHDLFSSVGPGVMSMLRTSTEMGNLAGLTGDMSGMGSLSRPPNRRNASSRLSNTSSMSGTSSRASHHHRQYPSSSSAARRSMTREPQYVADTLSPTLMNISGSPSLVPTHSMRSRDRDSGRSLSMTHAMQPTYRLSSNRSLGSLRGHDHLPRPNSPYHYPSRLRRPSHGPTSPALSDMTGVHPRRFHGPYGSRGQSHHPGQRQPYNPGQGQPYHPGQVRPRIPSDTSLGRQERMPNMSRRPSRNHPQAFYNAPRGDIPPVPPLFHHHMAVENARLAHRSAKSSFSSGYTNLRTDSDTPSSDAPSPPTPKGGLSMGVLINPTNNRMTIDTVTGVVKENLMSGPLYYDYSEQFEREEFTEPEVDPIPTGLTQRIKTIHEERGLVEPLSPGRVPRIEDIVDPVCSEVPGIVELPASPVARRITRDLILQALEPASTTDIEASNKSPAVGDDGGSAPLGHDGAVTGSGNDESSNSSLLPEDSKDHRHSILSQAGSSIMNSSTLEFAVRYSIPMATGTGLDTGPSPEDEGAPDSLSGPGASTEDGMSDLIGGYQHTELKQEEDVVPGHDAPAPPDEHGDSRRSKHVQKPSDEQSFKSCTDVPEPLSPERRSREQDAKSFKSCTDVSTEREVSMKKSDSVPSKTFKDLATPTRAVSLPPSRLPTSSLSTLDTPGRRPFSEMPLSSPAPAVIRKPHVPPRESSFSIAGGKFRTSSRPSMNQSSVSMSASSSTLSATQQPPSVPPRESSSSKEAQRSKDVAAYLMRRFMPANFAKGRKLIKEDDVTKCEGSDTPRSGELSQATLKSTDFGSPSQLSLEVIKTPEKVLTKQEAIAGKQKASPVFLKPRNSANVSDVSPTPVMHQHSFSSPVSGVPEASSVYSPQDSSLRPRVQSSPTGVPISPEQDRRDSQTTTHLVWHGRGSLNIPSASASAPHLPLSDAQDETTTDLRLSTFRYPGPPHYLPDLKEESHEDSSLNTSASNLKNSNFRFPFGVPSGALPGVRASVEDGFLFSRKSSVGSHRRSGAGPDGGLPSMNFSQMDLFERCNEALDLRGSRSMGGLRVDLLEVDEQRPASAEGMREKYRMSVVQKPGGEVHHTTIKDMFTLKRPYSPEDLKFKAEIDQLTIPSVGGLTQRISEIMPSLREYYKTGEAPEFPAEEIIMEHALEEIHEVGVPVQKRSSARLRPMPGSPNMVVIEDALYEELTGREKENGSPGSHGDGAAKLGTGEDKRVNGDNNLVLTPTRPITPVAELAVPSSAVLRPRSVSVGGYHDLRASVESTLSMRRSLRSFVSTPTTTDTRPWNSDKNYPWATSSIPSVDISLPLPTAIRHSPRPGPSHLRNTLSDASTATFTSTHTPTASPFGPTSGFDAQTRQAHRFSLFGCNSDVSHAAGERYPTSALTPPTAIFRDHLSASDTSDDEAELTTTRKSKFKLRKRFSSARAPDYSTLNVNVIPSHGSATSIQDEAHNFTATNRHTYREAEGMPAAKYHQHRLLALCRRWWHKGGDLIRSISSRRKESTATV